MPTTSILPQENWKPLAKNHLKKHLETLPHPLQLQVVAITELLTQLGHEIKNVSTNSKAKTNVSTRHPTKGEVEWTFHENGESEAKYQDNESNLKTERVHNLGICALLERIHNPAPKNKV